MTQQARSLVECFVAYEDSQLLLHNNVQPGCCDKDPAHVKLLALSEAAYGLTAAMLCSCRPPRDWQRQYQDIDHKNLP